MNQEELRKLAEDVRSLRKMTGGTANERKLASILVRLVALLAPHLEQL